ncbi:hypothetical protein [Flavobacterium sp. J27]|uniref:hypothetical protein n=1 Tax=Flavobacterium sp. J27 TaxID=2060419 RepID=UPI001031E4C3|nr:hypothetical protein [Flavobacterium sp. J27]
MNAFGNIIGILIFIIIFIPILLINNKLNKKRKRLIDALNQFAAQENKRVTEFDTWTDNSIIGISTDKEYLFFIRNKNDYHTKIKIPVNQIKNSYTNQQKNNSKSIAFLELIFEMQHQNENIRLEFFKADKKDAIMGEELRIAKKWIAKITEDLPKPKVLLYFT